MIARRASCTSGASGAAPSRRVRAAWRSAAPPSDNHPAILANRCCVIAQLTPSWLVSRLGSDYRQPNGSEYIRSHLTSNPVSAGIIGEREANDEGESRKNTSPELLLRRALRDAGLAGYRLHWTKAPGRPDIAYPGRRVAVFVNGCFWHRCPLCGPPLPKKNRAFWSQKFAENQARDGRKTEQLESLGWTVVVIWECQLKADPVRAVCEITRALGVHTRGAPT